MEKVLCCRFKNDFGPAILAVIKILVSGGCLVKRQFMRDDD
jgi:hypothetical protein